MGNPTKRFKHSTTIALALALVATLGPSAHANGALSLSATLDGAHGDNEAVVVVDNLDTMAFGVMTGTLTVLDGSGQPVDGAQVTGVVSYHGSSVNPVGLTIAEFQGSTGADGTYDFDYRHTVAGSVGYAGLMSLFGYHTITFTVVHDDGSTLDTGELVFRYWVRPPTSI